MWLSMMSYTCKHASLFPANPHLTNEELTDAGVDIDHYRLDLNNTLDTMRQEFVQNLNLRTNIGKHYVCFLF